jgi:hypothetical protein
MNRTLCPRNLLLAAATALAMQASLASASGLIEAVNESPVTIQPYFKSNCWGFGVAPGTTTWVFFGNIGGNGGRFAWDFTDPALTDPNCAHPVIQFTYGTNDVPPPDPQKGNRRAAVHFSPDTNAVFQIGKEMTAKELEGPDENGR